MPIHPVLSSGDTDATSAYLFHAEHDRALRAISRDPSGANLPSAGDGGNWISDGQFALGVREAVPAPIAPEPVLRGLTANGFFVWREGAGPMGTSQ